MWQNEVMRILQLLVALVALLTPVWADSPQTELRIEVKNTADKPIDRASVIVQFVEGRSIAKLGKKIQTRWELRTNQDGIAKLPSIPQGKVLVQVIAKGHQTFGDTFEVTEPQKTLQIKLNPPQQQYSVHQ